MLRLLSQMKRLHCAAQLFRLVFVGAGARPKSAVIFYFLRSLSEQLCRAIALAHSLWTSAWQIFLPIPLRQRMRGMGGHKLGLWHLRLRLTGAKSSLAHFCLWLVDVAPPSSVV